MAVRTKLVGLYLALLCLAFAGFGSVAQADDVPTGHGTVTVTAEKPEDSPKPGSSSPDPGVNPTDANPSPNLPHDNPDPYDPRKDPCAQEQAAYDAAQDAYDAAYAAIQNERRNTEARFATFELLDDLVHMGLANYAERGFAWLQYKDAAAKAKAAQDAYNKAAAAAQEAARQLIACIAANDK